MASQALFGPRFDRQSQYRDRLAAQLIAEGSDASPIQHPLQGAARLAQALAGGYIGMKQDQRYAEREKQSSEAMANLFAPTQQFTPSAAGAGPRPGAQMQTAQPTLAELAQRAAAHPATAHLAPQFQMQDISARQAAEQRGKWTPAEQNGLKGQVNTATGEFKPDPLPRPGAQPQRFMNVGGALIDVSGDKPRVAYQAPAEPANPNAGPFSGNAMDAQAWNIVANPNADRSSPAYLAAHAHLTQPKLQMVPGPDGQPQMQLVTPRIPFPAPGQQTQATPQPAAPQAAPNAAPAMPPAQELPGVTVQPVAPPRTPPLTETQGKAGGFADRMAASDAIINRIGDIGTSYAQQGLASVPGVGNSLVNQQFQSFDQARRDFINATLRRESGAVISPQEFDNAEKQYFPRPGDSKETIAQKARNRRTTLEGIAREAGPTYKLPGSVTPPLGNGETADPPLPAGFRIVQ